MLLLDVLAQLPHARDLGVIGAQLDHSLDDKLPVVGVLLLLLEHHGHVVLVLLGAAEQLGEDAWLKLVIASHFLDRSALDGHLPEHSDLLSPAVVAHPLHGFPARRGSGVG